MAFGLLLLLGIFSVSISSFNAYINYIGADFITALSLRDEPEFKRHLYRYLFAFCGATLIVVFYRYTEERFALHWRRWLSITLLRRYFQDQAFYRVNFFEGIDNPDQRIEEDVRSFTSTTLSFTLIIFNSVIALVLFSKILWEISFWLMIAAFCYAFIGSIVTYFLGRPLIGLNFSQLKKDADYRYRLINVRDNAESIALLGGEGREFSRVRQKLKVAIRNMRALIDWNRNLNFFTNGYNYLAGIIPTVIVAPLYLNGSIEFGKVTQAASAFGFVLGALSIIVLNFGSLSSFAAVITRLGSFVEALEDASKRNIGSREKRISLKSGLPLSFSAVTILTPKRDQEIIRDLSFRVERSLFITGPSGAGKSSVLRVIAGIWSSGSGTVQRPALEECFFLPQRPYLVSGTLRSQFLYPKNWPRLTEERLRSVIEKVGLKRTVARMGGLEAVEDWAKMLSAGEQQQLNFARVLLARPKYVFLDEATSALDLNMERYYYSLLSEFAELIVSVGYHDELRKVHKQILELKGSGEWEILPGGTL